MSGHREPTVLLCCIPVHRSNGLDCIYPGVCTRIGLFHTVYTRRLRPLDPSRDAFRRRRAVWALCISIGDDSRDARYTGNYRRSYTIRFDAIRKCLTYAKKLRSSQLSLPRRGQNSSLTKNNLKND